MSEENCSNVVEPPANNPEIPESLETPVADEIDPMVNSVSSEKSLSANEDEETYEHGGEILRLRTLLDTKQTENSLLESKLIEQEQQSKTQIEQLHQNFTQKLEQTLKKFQDGQKDKTSSMVMKYAEGEKRCIDLNQKINFLN